MLIGFLTLVGYYLVFRHLNRYKKKNTLYDEICNDIHLIETNPQAIIMKHTKESGLISIYNATLMRAIFSGYPLKKRLQRLRDVYRDDIKLKRRGKSISISLIVRISMSLVGALILRYFLWGQGHYNTADFFACFLGSLVSFLGLYLFQRLMASPPLTQSSQAFKDALEVFFSLAPGHIVTDVTVKKKPVWPAHTASLDDTKSFDQYADEMSRKQSEVEDKLKLLEDISSLFELIIASILISSFNIMPMLTRFLSN